MFNLEWISLLIFTDAFFTFLYIVAKDFMSEIPTQSGFTCSKLTTIETLEQGVRYVQS